ncbi:MAG TPA: hypothetical protein EYN79_02000 [Planctomycetes bacterium]|nr:hypothetical protein [Planctomycetota bacterium]HIN80552.1 hypothetical protein [Planctomycetota bacterium]
MTEPRIGLVTCLKPPEPDPDEEMQLSGFADRGAVAEMVPWDDPGVDPGRYDLLLLRSCWNYYKAPAEFLNWLTRAGAVTSVLNTCEIVRWNLHKSYLIDLERAGIPVIPTRVLRRNNRVSFDDLRRETGWDDVVIKPAISAGSYLTRRFEADDGIEAQRFIDFHLSERDLLIQPFLELMAAGGERALVWIAGKFTHAVVKKQRFSGDVERISERLDPLAEEVDFATRVIGKVSGTFLYGRVDSFLDESGERRLAELELIEPSLFFLQDRSALDRLVSAVLEHLGWSP